MALDLNTLLRLAVEQGQADTQPIALHMPPPMDPLLAASMSIGIPGGGPMEPVQQVPSAVGSGNPGFAERIGLELNDAPVSFRPTGNVGQNAVAQFLTSMANQYGRSTARSVTKREQLDEALKKEAAAKNERNIALSDAARALARQRYDKKKEMELASSLRASETKAELEQRNAFTAEQNRLDRESAERIARIREAGASRGLPAGPQGDATLGYWANALATNQAKLPQVPREIRSPLLAYMAQNGINVVPDKVRNTITELASARSIVQEMKDELSRVNAPRNFAERATTGALNVVGAATQANTAAASFNASRESFLATLARAAGERGVLTDQDIARARKMTPGLTDTRAFRESRWSRIEAWLDNMEERAMTAQTAPNAGRGTGRDANWKPSSFEPLPAGR